MTKVVPGETGPLAGLRVVELAGIGPGPYAAMLLADLGAEVVRVDRPEKPTEGQPLEWHRQQLLQRGRRSIGVDLQHPRGAEVVLSLVEKADVLLEGFRPGVAERLGLGPDDCLTRNPKLVYGRMTGWGQTGSWASMAGHDINYIALTGALHAIGRTDAGPTPPLNLVGDFGGGSLFLVFGVLAALYEVARSGKGQVVDAAIVDGAASLMTLIYGMRASGDWIDERGSNLLDTGCPWYDVYRTADDRFIAVGPIEPKFFAKFMTLLGFGEVLQPEGNEWPDLRDRIGQRIAARTRGEWEATFAGTDACVAPVLSMDEASRHPHMSERGVLPEVDGIRQPAPAPRFSRTRPSLGLRPCAPGEHSREVLTDWGASLDPQAADAVFQR